jgi:[ribosomal protein S5]-alanine N-acetyltransferase
MHTIILETERLILRQHENDDLDAYCAMEMDANVRRFVGGYPRKREDAEKRFPDTKKQITDGLAMWATILKAEDKYIGRCGIYQHMDGEGKPIPGEASLGLYIAINYWGNGYATEAGRALVQMGIELLQLDRIVTMVQVGNDASVKVLEKLGFRLEKTEVGEWRTFYHFVLERKPN